EEGISSKRRSALAMKISGAQDRLTVPICLVVYYQHQMAHIKLAQLVAKGITQSLADARGQAFLQHTICNSTFGVLVLKISRVILPLDLPRKLSFALPTFIKQCVQLRVVTRIGCDCLVILLFRINQTLIEGEANLIVAGLYFVN